MNAVIPWQPRAGTAQEAAEEGVAAFFDLDGTLLRPPSLEKRWFRELRSRRLITTRNYFGWLVEAARLLPHGIEAILHANKMYLRGVAVEEASWERGDGRSTRRKAAESLRDLFYRQALQRLAWHAKQGHAILIVSGSLQPLALGAAAALEDGLAARGLRTAIGVYATRLEAREGRWTGRVAGEAMFGAAKARAIREIAASRRFELEKCFAYGDSANDRWMLEAVGKPVAVNPSNDLARIAARNGWPILRWNNERDSTQSSLDARLGPHSGAFAPRLCAPQPKSGKYS